MYSSIQQKGRYDIIRELLSRNGKYNEKYHKSTYMKALLHTFDNSSRSKSLQIRTFGRS